MIPFFYLLEGKETIFGAFGKVELWSILFNPACLCPNWSRGECRQVWVGVAMMLHRLLLLYCLLLKLELALLQLSS